MLSSSDESVIVMFKKGKYTLIVNKNKIAPEIDHIIKNDVWNHLALSLNAKDKTVRLFHNGKMIVNLDDVEVNLKKIGKTSLMICPEFTGRITEIRLWKKAKDIDDVKSNMTTPLSIVSEQTAMIIISIKKPTDSKTKQPEDTSMNNVGFDFGSVIDVQPKDDGGGFDNWNFGSPSTNPTPEDDWGNKSSKVKSPDIKESKKDSFQAENDQISMKRTTMKLNKQDSPVALTTLPNVASEPSGLISGPNNEAHPEANAWGISISKPTSLGSDSDGWGLKSAPTQIRPSKEIKDTDNLSGKSGSNKGYLDQSQNKQWSLFQNKRFQPAMYFDENIEHLFNSQFNTADNPNAFQQKLSSLLLNVVKKCRGLYLHEDYENAIKLVDRVFMLFKNVDFQLTKQLEVVYLKFDAETITKLRNTLKKFMNYKYWLLGLSKVRTLASPAAGFIIFNYLLSLPVMDMDKTLLSYSLVDLF